MLDWRVLPNELDFQVRNFSRFVFCGASDPVKKPFTHFWLLIWSLALSLGWLLPNHYLPWPSFHLEAWVAILLSAAALVVFLRTSGGTSLYGTSLVALALVLVPWAQYLAGMQEFIGVVYVATAYLLGFGLAMIVGARWEADTPGQLADGLFLAIGFAALSSVGLQLHQWLQLDRLFLWDMGNQTGRPFANFGQPNLAGTFLLWGLLATAWGLQRKYIGLTGALVLALYLLFGVALTGSRTAWMGVAIVVAATWLWRKSWRSSRTPLLVTALGAFFWASLHIKGWVLEQLLMGSVEDLTRIAGETRPQIWAMLLDAAFERPIFGYGWGQIGAAHLEVASEQRPLYMLFSNAHNTLLDLMLWCGIPLGLLIDILALWWLWRSMRVVKNAEDVLLLMLILVIGNHAMLEYPLSYGYLLLPVGLVIGMLNVRLGFPSWRAGGRWVLFCLWIPGVLLLTVMVRDYSRVESSYLALRFEFANLQSAAPKEPPDVLVLTHLREMIRYARFEPHPGMSEAELKWMLGVANLYPSAGIIHKLAAALAWNGRPAEARLWLARMCKMVHPGQCEAVRSAWANQALNDPLIRAIPWPASEAR